MQSVEMTEAQEKPKEVGFILEKPSTFELFFIKKIEHKKRDIYHVTFTNKRVLELYQKEFSQIIDALIRRIPGYVALENIGKLSKYV